MASVLQRPPLELALRAMLGFGMAIVLAAWLGPRLVEGLLPLHENLVHRLDDHYSISLTLTHETGHDKVGNDLVVLGRAKVERLFIYSPGATPTLFYPGTELKCSIATGLLLQPLIALLGLLLAWPLHSCAEAAKRVLLGLGLGAAWATLGIAMTWWLALQSIPNKVYAPESLSLFILGNQAYLNGGAIFVGMAAAAAVLYVTSQPVRRLR